MFCSAEGMLAFCAGIILADLVCIFKKTMGVEPSLVSVRQEPMLGSEVCKLKRGGKKNPGSNFPAYTCAQWVSVSQCVSPVISNKYASSVTLATLYLKPE